MTHNAKKYGLMIIAVVLLAALAFAGAASADSVAVSTQEDVKNNILVSSLSGTMTSNQNNCTVTFATKGEGTLSAEDGDEKPVKLPLTDVPHGTYCYDVNDHVDLFNEDPLYEVYVTAKPKAGSQFARWEGIPATENITGPVTITAVFEKNNVLEPGTYTADQWNDAMKNKNMYLKSGTYAITGTGCIEPRTSISVDPLDQGTEIILDFSAYEGTFKGCESKKACVGALFGTITVLPNQTLEIKGLNLISVNVESMLGFVGGIIGTFRTASKEDKGTLIFTDCHLVDCSISGDGYIGGLVSDATSADAVIITSCSLEHCDIKGKRYVGGLIHSGHMVQLTDCLVSHSTITANYGFAGEVGGLATCIYGALTAKRCSVEDTSVYSSGEIVGGMIGMLYAYPSRISEISDCSVKNCVITTPQAGAGGIIARIQSATFTIKDSQVIGSTITGWKFVGGLVGVVDDDVTLSGCSGNSVVNSAVKGDGPDVNLDCGTNPEEVGCTADLKKNYLYQEGPELNADPVQDIIILREADGTECDVDSTEFWHTIYDTNASSTRGLPSAVVTSLKTYGKLGGYGVSSAPSYSVTYDRNGADVTGTVPQDTASYLLRMPVTLAGKGDLAKSGYTFSGWNTRADGSGTAYAAGSIFRITGPTTMYAQWIASPGHSPSLPKDYTPSGYVEPMVQETAQPTATPTPAAPTMMPTTKPTSSTSKSPAPVAGLIAGLGIAGLVLRLRK